MKVQLVLVSAGSMLVPAAGVAGFSFETAISQTADAPAFSEFSEYVIGNGGQIAAIGIDANMQRVLVYQPGDAPSPMANVIAVEGLNTYDNGDIVIGDAHTWDRLSLTGPAGAPQITFTNGTTVYRHQSDSMYMLYGSSSGGIYNSINPSGKVLVTVDELHLGNPHIYTSEVSGGSVVITGPVVAGFHPNTSGPIQQHTVTAADEIIFMDNASPRTIHSAATFTDNDPGWVNTEVINGNTINPVHLLGATDNEIFFVGEGATASDDNGVYLRSGTYASPVYHQLFTSGDDLYVEGMISPTGRAVATVTNQATYDQTLVYWDGNTSHELTAAAAGMISVDRPMISDGADIVLFVGTGDRSGLYGWDPDGGVFPIIEGFSMTDFSPATAMIDGAEASVLFVELPTTVGYHSDLISDDGHLVVAVTLGDNLVDFESWSTRLVTVLIPEPSMLAPLGMLAMTLLRRRRAA